MSDPENETTIYIIDDEAMLRAAYRALLEKLSGVRVVGASGSARVGIGEIEKLRPDVVILDITMSGLSGIDAIGPIKRASPKTRILMASTHESDSLVQQSLKEGADGYISKSSDPEELRLAVDSLQSGRSYISPRVATALVAKVRGSDGEKAAMGSRLDELTPREREVFQLIALGKANKEIATTLHLSLATIKKHRENLQRKLDVHSAAMIARIAIREGLLSV